ncbi:protein SRC2-like [Rutidosis leptorrhynchoides]|uniref:protein SRC2-like n=1 Tax=Rutidosis leptorrhynchoides TaxID=125765 RepID=UPI003A9A11D8
MYTEAYTNDFKKFPVEDSAINTTNLLFVLRQRRFWGDKNIGEVSIPVRELVELDTHSGTSEHVVDYQVKTVRGKSVGTFTFSHQFIEKPFPARDSTGTSGSNHPPGPAYMIIQQGMPGYQSPYSTTPQGYVNYLRAGYGNGWYPQTTPPGGYAYPHPNKWVIINSGDQRSNKVALDTLFDGKDLNSYNLNSYNLGQYQA